MGWLGNLLGTMFRVAAIGAIAAAPAAGGMSLVFLGILVWPVVFLYIYIGSIGFDLTQSLPWAVVQADWGWVLAFSLISLLTGFIAGPAGVLAMFSTWVMTFLCLIFMVWTGVAIRYDEGSSWARYVVMEYVKGDCQPPVRRYDGLITIEEFCLYRPKTLAVPSFTMDANGKILNVIPYNGPNRNTTKSAAASPPMSEPVPTKALNQGTYTGNRNSPGGGNISPPYYPGSR